MSKHHKREMYDWEGYYWKKGQLHYNPYCFYCGEELTIYTASIDHKSPLSKGGLDIDENKVLSCYVCNGKKSNMEFHDFLEKRCGYH